MIGQSLLLSHFDIMPPGVFKNGSDESTISKDGNSQECGTFWLLRAVDYQRQKITAKIVP